MAVVSIRDEIIKNIKTTLQGITIANGYNETVKLVATENFKLPEQLTIDELPALFIIDGNETKTHGDVDSVDCSFTITIEGILLKENDVDSIQEKRRKLQRDVEKALMTDEYRNKKAIFTQVQTIITDKATLEPYTVFNIDIIVKYYHNRFDPANQDNSPTP